MTDHRFCLHTADKAGRAACRKAGSPRVYHYNLRLAMVESAPCSDCYYIAEDVARDNLATLVDDNPGCDDHIIAAMIAVQARDYLFDRSAITGCSAHQHLLD